MKPTAPFRNTFSVLAAAPCRAYLCFVRANRAGARFTSSTDRHFHLFACRDCEARGSPPAIHAELEAQFRVRARDAHYRDSVSCAAVRHWTLTATLAGPDILARSIPGFGRLVVCRACNQCLGSGSRLAWRSSTLRMRVLGDGRFLATASRSFAYSSQFSPHDTALTNRSSQPLFGVARQRRF